MSSGAAAGPSSPTRPQSPPHLGGRRQDLAALEGLGIKHRDRGALRAALRQGQQPLGGAGRKGGRSGLGAARQQALHPSIRLVQHQGVASGVDQAALVAVGQLGGGAGGGGMRGAPAPPAAGGRAGGRGRGRSPTVSGPLIRAPHLAWSGAAPVGAAIVPVC